MPVLLHHLRISACYIFVLCTTLLATEFFSLSLLCQTGDIPLIFSPFTFQAQRNANIEPASKMGVPDLAPKPIPLTEEDVCFRMDSKNRPSMSYFSLILSYLRCHIVKGVNLNLMGIKCKVVLLPEKEHE